MLGCIVTIAAQYGWQAYKYKKNKSDIQIFSVVKLHINNELEGAKVLDLSANPNPKVKVNYKYDKLWDVSITYEKDNKIKKISALYGLVGDTWISPRKSELMVLDDKAQIIHDSLKKNNSKEQQGQTRKTENY